MKKRLIVYRKMPELYLLLFASFIVGVSIGFWLGILYNKYEEEMKYGLKK